MFSYIPVEIKKAAKVLKACGIDAYVAGRIMRHRYSGRLGLEYELAAAADVDALTEMLVDYRPVMCDPKCGGIQITIDKLIARITPMGCVELREYLSRRDFTVNAMAVSLEGELFDFFGGKSDLDNKILRTVCQPEQAFAEDPARLLRALRYASELDFSIEPNTRRTLFSSKSLLEKIPPEMINRELCGLVCGGNAGQVILEYFPVIAVFIPEIEKCAGFDQKTKYHKYDVLEHICRSMDAIENKRSLRLAMLFHDMGKPFSYTEEKGRRHFKGHAEYSAALAERTMTALHFDRAAIDLVLFLVLYHDYPIGKEQLNRNSIKRLLAKFGSEGLRNLCLVHIADDSAKADFAKDRIPVYREAIAMAEQIINDSESCSTIKPTD